MRDDESDEANDAAGRDEHACEERQQSHVEAALRARVDAERDGELLSEQQHVERTQLREEVDGERSDDEDGQEEAVPFCIREAAHRPERGRLHALRIRRYVDDEVRHRNAQSADRRTREYELHRRDATMHPREYEYSERSEDSADEGAARHTERDRRRADEDRECCADGRARGDAEDEGLCERVLHARLHDNPRECKPRARCHRKQDARHAQRPDDVRDGRIGGGDAARQLCRDDSERIAGRDRDTARRYSKDGGEEKQSSECGR